MPATELATSVMNEVRLPASSLDTLALPAARWPSMPQTATARGGASRSILPRGPLSRPAAPLAAPVESPSPGARSEPWPPNRLTASFPTRCLTASDADGARTKRVLGPIGHRRMHPLSDTKAIEKRGGHHGSPPALKLRWDDIVLQRGGEQ